MKSSKIRTAIVEFLFLTLGCAIFSLAWEGFMIPNNMSAGGLMGLCTLIQYASSDAIPASMTYIGINAVLILISIIAFGISFGFKTLYCILMTTVFLEIASGLDFLHADAGHFFYIREPLLVPIVAGFLEALAIGIIIRNGGSTGGTDIIALMVNKYWPISLSKVFLVTDFIIICAMLLLPDRTFSDCMYGIEMMVTFSIVIDIVIGGAQTSFQLLVFSEKYQEIADYIIGKLDRGVTVIHAQGWYTKAEKDVLLILISNKQMPELSKTIKLMDPKAFISVSRTANVYGEGFEEIKTGLSSVSIKKSVSNENK